MINFETVSLKLEKLQEYVSYLKGYQKHTIEALKKDYTLQGAVLHYLQLAIECVIDIGEVLISELRLRKPQESREVIKILGDSGVIPKDFAECFAPVSGFRNILVHEYVKVDLEKVYTHLQNNLKDFDFFAKHIAEYIKRS